MTPTPETPATEVMTAPDSAQPNPQQNKEETVVNSANKAQVSTTQKFTADVNARLAQEVAAFEAECGPGAMKVAMDNLRRLRATPAAVEAGLRWNKTTDGLPKKPGKRDYEQIECLIMLPDGDIEISMWNCEHEVWDDAEGDDFRYDPGHPTHWLALAPFRAALCAQSAPVVETETRYRLEWLSGARPPVHPKPMRGRQAFDTADEAVAFFKRQASDAKPLALTEIKTITWTRDITDLLPVAPVGGEVAE